VTASLTVSKNLIRRNEKKIMAQLNGIPKWYLTKTSADGNHYTDLLDFRTF
jgi:hypothetical protein